MPDFIPRKDSLAAHWAAHFVQHVAGDAARFNLPAETIALLVQRQADFAEAVRVASHSGTRTAVTVEAKRAARAAFETVARQVAGIVRGMASNDRVTLIQLGLATGPGRGAPRRRVGRPASAPVVSVRLVDGSRVTIQLKNTDTPGRRGMHADIADAHLYTFVGEQYPAALNEWKHYGGSSRGIKTIDFGSAHRPGTQVWITARWGNRRGEFGAHATPVMTFLGYCGAAARAA